MIKRNLVIIWIALSFAAWLGGIIWRNIDPTNSAAFLLNFNGWVSSLLAVGYYSTPSQSIYGKIAYTGVVVMVAGIAMKILVLTGANESIVIGLLIIVGAYGVMWLKRKPSS